jgi:hypothetical protein
MCDWDEREETPWPIIQEAARIGLYSFELVANMFGGCTGLLTPVGMEEMAALGQCRDRAGHLRRHPRGGRLVATVPADQVAEWVAGASPKTTKFSWPQLFRVSEPNGSSDVGSPASRLVLPSTTAV